MGKCQEAAWTKTKKSNRGNSVWETELKFWCKSNAKDDSQCQEIKLRV
jgi:hypothetical protein